MTAQQQSTAQPAAFAEPDRAVTSRWIAVFSSSHISLVRFHWHARIWQCGRLRERPATGDRFEHVRVPLGLPVRR